MRHLLGVYIINTQAQLQVQEFGTVYPPHCGSLALNLDTLNNF